MANQERIPLIGFAAVEGGGKSEQAKILKDKFGLTYVSTGDMIRERAEKDQGEIGDACREVRDHNIYLKPVYLLQMLEERLSREDASRGIVLDGGFRTLEETEKFNEMLAKTGKNFSLMIFHLDVPFWEGAERRLKMGRYDDTPEGVMKRIREYNTDLRERFSLMRENWPFERIRCHGKSIEQVHSEILVKLKENEEKLRFFELQ